VHSPSIHTPGVGEPSFHISFAWLFDLFSLCWRVIWFIILIPWWVILLALLIGRLLWLSWKRRKEAEER
jgi:hypothetical protein